MKIALNKVHMTLAALVFACALALAMPCAQAFAVTVTTQVPVNVSLVLEEDTDMDQVNAEVLQFELVALTPGAPMPEETVISVPCTDLIETGEYSTSFNITYDDSMIGKWEYELHQIQGENVLWSYSIDSYRLLNQIFWYDDNYDKLESTLVVYDNTIEEEIKADVLFVNIPPLVEVEPIHDDPNGYDKTGAEVNGIFVLIGVLAMAALALGFYAKRRRD